MKNYRRHTVQGLAIMLVAAPALLLAAENETMQPGAGMEEQVQRAAFQKGEPFTARVVEMQADVLRLSSPELKAERTLHLPSELLKALGKITDRTFTVNAVERSLPSGPSTAVTLTDARGLYAVAESIRDRSLFRPEDRAGIEVEPLPSQSRTLVYESECAIVYNVPAAFTIDRKRYVLLPDETKEVQIGSVPYMLSLQSSRWIVSKPCPAVSEGPGTQIDYVLVRKGNGG